MKGVKSIERRNNAKLKCVITRIEAQKRESQMRNNANKGEKTSKSQMRNNVNKGEITRKSNALKP